MGDAIGTARGLQRIAIVAETTKKVSAEFSSKIKSVEF